MRRIAAATGLPVVDSEFDSLTETEADALKQMVCQMHFDN